MGEDRIRDDGRDERVTVAEAAERLGISKEAVRKRISRGTLGSDKGADGTVHVYIPPSGTPSGTASESIGRDDLVDLLRAQLEDLRADRDAWRDQARRSDYMASTAMDRTRELENRIRELEAPSTQQAPEDTETVEEVPDRAEPRSATGGTQEGTEHPQQRGGWLAPVNRLPWWHYVLGLSFTLLAAYIGGYVSNSSIFIRIWGSMHDLFAISLPIILAGIWAPPGVFGFWIGLRLQNPRVWSRIIPLGALVGVASVLGAYCGFRGFLMLRDTTIDIPIGEFLFAGGFIGLPSWLLFVSASLIGNAWQRRRTGRVSGTTPVSPASRAAQGAAQQPRKDLTPAQQAILGWGGAIISALITLVGTIILG